MIELQGVVDYQEGDVKGGVVVEPKLDGWRCIIKWLGGVPVLRTRNGEEITLPHLQREAALLMPPSYFLDGELTHPCGFGAIKSAIARRDEDLQYHAFDIVSTAVLIGEFDPCEYQERRRLLESTFDSMARTYGTENMHIVTSVYSTEADIYTNHKLFIEEGYEGTVIKLMHSYYRTGKAGNWMRIKDVDTADCVIEGMTESDLEPGTLKNIIVRNGDGIVTRVGTGFDSRTRRKMFARRGQLIGQVGEVAYRGLYPSGKMKHASFVRLRPDKTAHGQGVFA